MFFAGQYFDALLEVNEIIGAAIRSVVLVDGYVSPDTLGVLSSGSGCGDLRILTRDVSSALRTAAQAYVKQYGGLEIRKSTAFHDRFLVIDDREVYHLGASVKDLGHRGCMFSRVEEPDVLALLIARLKQEWLGAKPVI